MNLGEAILALSFAMFYNRVGWAALTAEFRLEEETPPRAHPHPPVIARPISRAGTVRSARKEGLPRRALTRVQVSN
jgi:hypothetical protein